MKQTRSQHITDRVERRLRAAVAIIVALLMLAVALPNTQHARIDVTTAPPTAHVENDVIAIAIVLAMTLLPLTCVLGGLRRVRRLELVGWLL
jgi:hypothetical protein